MFEFLQRTGKSWDDRVLEGQSMRRVFVWLMLAATSVGGGISMMLYKLIRFHRIDWFNQLSFLPAVLLIVHYGIAFYRRLER
jgi:hypothetical protein